VFPREQRGLVFLRTLHSIDARRAITRFAEEAMANPSPSAENLKIEQVTTRMIVFAWLWAAVILYFALRAALS
jgi:hypothetical protein